MFMNIGGIKNMNIQEADILNALWKEPFVNQRILAEITGHSLGVVNKSLKSLMREGYLDEQVALTEKSHALFLQNKPKNAVILAAGYGMRMVPINTELPKGLIEVNGEPLIERTIRQLQECGICNIYVVVGFMKESYEYLIDEYGVEFLYNDEYSLKNNLHSLYQAKNILGNSYIIPCDIWCSKNPYKEYELYSWYMVSDLVDDESSVRVNRKMELVSIPAGVGGNSMIGISYLNQQDGLWVKEKLEKLAKDSHYDRAFWEETLYEGNRMIVPARVVHSRNVVEINTYEQLRDLDSGSQQLETEAITIIKDVLQVKNEDIVDISILKKGMTNRSFLFSCKEKKYIMRIPGEGTDQLIDRRQEAGVYEKIAGRNICDDVFYINPENGYKITEFLSGARVCDPFSEEDVKKCMEKLKSFHEEGLKVDHTFDIFRQIEFYQSLWKNEKSVYRDHERTTEKIYSLKEYIESHCEKMTLTHIDAVPDNFLFYTNIQGEEEIRLIDWEYAGMQDPHVDIAMFAIYSLYDRAHVDRLIDLYFTGKCPKETRIKIYCYIAVCGLLWSNWCEYKRQLGVEFGEYSIRQYRYAKDYYRIVKEELGNWNCET